MSLFWSYRPPALFSTCHLDNDGGFFSTSENSNRSRKNGINSWKQAMTWYQPSWLKNHFLFGGWSQKKKHKELWTSAWQDFFLMATNDLLEKAGGLFKKWWDIIVNGESCLLGKLVKNTSGEKTTAKKQFKTNFKSSYYPPHLTWNVMEPEKIILRKGKASSKPPFFGFKMFRFFLGFFGGVKGGQVQPFQLRLRWGLLVKQEVSIRTQALFLVALGGIHQDFFAKSDAKQREFFCCCCCCCCCLFSEAPKKGVILYHIGPGDWTLLANLSGPLDRIWLKNMGEFTGVVWYDLPVNLPFWYYSSLSLPEEFKEVTGKVPVNIHWNIPMHIHRYKLSQLHKCENGYINSWINAHIRTHIHTAKYNYTPCCDLGH